jgi:hypothetical protein
MGPEFLGAGLIRVERLVLRLLLLLCVGLTGPRRKGDCCKRKNGSIECRFHRVTPYAAERLRLLLILDVLRGEVGLI